MPTYVVGYAREERQGTGSDSPHPGFMAGGTSANSPTVGPFDAHVVHGARVVLEVSIREPTDKHVNTE